MFFKNYFYYGVWFLLTVFLAYWFSYPFDIFSQHNFFGATDSTIGLWSLNWQLSQISSGNLDQIFTGNSFYPLDKPIYFSPPIFSTVVLTLPVFLVTKDPYICYTVAIFSSYVLSSLGMLLLARNLKLDRVASILAAIIFTFSESRYSIHNSITLMMIQWMPFILLFIHKYFSEQRRAFLYVAALFYLMQITASGYHGIFFSIILIVFISILSRQQSFFSYKKFFRDSAPPILIVGIVAGIYFFPYLQAIHEFELKRGIAEQSAYGASLASFFSSPSSYFLGPWTSHFNHIEGNTSPRYFPVVLTIVGLLIIRKNIPPVDFPFPLKINFFLVGAIFFTLITWFFKSSINSLGQKIYSDLVLHPQLVPTILLTPLFLSVTAYFFATKFIRRIYQGLFSENIFLLYFSIAIVAFIVSLGPIIKLYGNQHIMINPITTFLYYTFPGFSSIRAVSRISILIPLGLGITAGISYMLIKERLNNPYFKMIFIVSIFAFLLLEIYPAKSLQGPYKQPRDKIPKEYSWLKQAPNGPVLEWPVNSHLLGDMAYLERSMIHQKKLVNGTASFGWDGRKKLAELTDLSSRRDLLSLYAFGVRYLVVHRIDGVFPEWAGKTIGEFHQVEKFKNALVYLNKKAKTNFLPQNFLDYISVSIKKVNDKNHLILEFQSPEIHYVSKNKKKLNVRMNRESDSNFSYYEFIFYPSLWRDGDKYELILDKDSNQVPKFVELVYSNPEKKDTKFARKIMIK